MDSEVELTAIAMSSLLSLVNDKLDDIVGALEFTNGEATMEQPTVASRGTIGGACWRSYHNNSVELVGMRRGIVSGLN